VRSRALAAGAGSAAAVLLVASCSTPGSGSAPEASANTLIVATPTEPDTLDPTFAGTFAARMEMPHGSAAHALRPARSRVPPDAPGAAVTGSTVAHRLAPGTSAAVAGSGTPTRQTEPI
jgi:ABC-type transport system substrate-binding protein